MKRIFPSPLAGSQASHFKGFLQEWVPCHVGAGGFRTGLDNHLPPPQILTQSLPATKASRCLQTQQSSEKHPEPEPVWWSSHPCSCRGSAGCRLLRPSNGSSPSFSCVRRAWGGGQETMGTCHSRCTQCIHGTKTWLLMGLLSLETQPGVLCSYGKLLGPWGRSPHPWLGAGT